jgi:glutamate-1-semialdehyde 2,1-aminomutase
MAAPLGGVYQAGTLTGNPIATTAGIETLKILREQPDLYSKIEHGARWIVDAVRETLETHVCVLCTYRG